ncbi:MAG TPA: APC family permease [Gemmatimonadales bacterium]|nr:APC family permease [Gemmatimonadales bacterium]
MSEPGSQAVGELPRALTLRDLVLFNLVAVIGVRWLATAAYAGPSSLTLWILAALLFFVPQGLAVADLAARYPDEGGIYRWTQRAFGEGHGFLCGWCYWINNVLYYPSLLLSSAAIATYAFGAGDSGLADRWEYIAPVTLGGMWLAVGLNVVGLRWGRWLQNVGGIGTYGPGAILVLLGVWAALTRPSANPIGAAALVPDVSDPSRVNLWASIAFAYAGLELSATLSGEVKDPRRTVPRSILIAAPLIALLYLAGTGAILWLVPHGELNIVTGMLQAISAATRELIPALAWIVPLAAAANAIGNLGGVGAWLSGSARVAFVVGVDRYFPPAFGRIHPRWGTPYLAILAQAGLSTVFLLASVLGKGTGVEEAYLILLDTMLLVYFIPYIYLFVCYLKAGRQAEGRAGSAGWRPGRRRTWLIGLSGLFVTVFAMGVAMIPPPGTTRAWLFELKVVGGAIAFVAAGGLLYWRARREGARATLREAA